jgi:hypothetical protein
MLILLLNLVHQHFVRSLVILQCTDDGGKYIDAIMWDLSDINPY